MAVGETRNEAVRRLLADVTGRENDALRVVVAQPENRIGEIVARPHRRERRQVELLRLDDRPVAVVDFDIRIPGVDHTRGDFLAVVDDLHRRDLARSSAGRLLSSSATTACFTVMK